MYNTAIISNNLVDRFWAKVDLRQSVECWPWLGINRRGYGAIAVDPKVKSKRVLAHRVSWMISNGELEEGMEVLHSCGSKLCVNPSHLYALPRKEAGVAKTRHLVRPKQPRRRKSPKPKKTRMSQDEMFWRRVEKSATCWLWKGHVTKRGYGWLAKRDVNEKGYSAHRFSFALHHGPIPKHLVVMHTCDVRACVNPEHLRLGTALENIRDMVSKGRAHWQKASQNENW